LHPTGNTQTDGGTISLRLDSIGPVSAPTDQNSQSLGITGVAGITGSLDVSGIPGLQNVTIADPGPASRSSEYEVRNGVEYIFVSPSSAEATISFEWKNGQWQLSSLAFGSFSGFSPFYYYWGASSDYMGSGTSFDSLPNVVLTRQG
jgi:hypothetical protein